MKIRIFIPKSYLEILLEITLIFCFTANVLANGSSYYEGDGSTIFPIENKSIVLKKEIVRIKPDSKGKSQIMETEAKLRWLATCEFVFYNKSDAEELVTMGYPDWLNHEALHAVNHENEQASEIISKYIDSDKEAKRLFKYHLDNNSIYGYAKAYFKGYQEGKLPYVKEAWIIHDLKVKVDKHEVRTSHKPISLKISLEKIR